MGLIKNILSVFYPNTCDSCGTVIDENEFLCEYCMTMIERVDLEKLCVKCGNLKKHCKCSRYVLFYDGCAAPLYNKGIAKRIMYSFKFRRGERKFHFLARQMAITVRQMFYGVDFDAICCVPIEFKRELQRGYNQSALLAAELAKIMKLPFYKDTLGCYKKKSFQHKVYGKERFKNVEGVYYVKAPIKNKTVLLVDDIKTTGATLSECAKQLLASGSNRVYCITAVITERKEKKNGN